MSVSKSTASHAMLMKNSTESKKKKDSTKNSSTKSLFHTSKTKSKAEREEQRLKAGIPEPAKKAPSVKKLKAKEKLKNLLLNQQAASTSSKVISNSPSPSPSSTSTTPSQASSTRAMLDEMIILSENDGELSSSNELPHENMILNTAEVEKIIEQIVTDIEDLSSSDEEIEGASDIKADEEDDEFGEEAANAGIPRYFLENSGPKCFNCGQSGHVLKDCTAGSTIPCHLCGEMGHTRFNCPQEMCFNCGRPGHHSRDCPQKRRRRVFGDETCNRCGQPGHLNRECSMSWRGYVFAQDLPRSHSDFLEELRALRKRCYNCASISHFGDDCPSARRPYFSVFHIPEYDYLDQVILCIRRTSCKGADSKAVYGKAKNSESKKDNTGSKNKYEDRSKNKQQEQAKSKHDDYSKNKREEKNKQDSKHSKPPTNQPIQHPKPQPQPKQPSQILKRPFDAHQHTTNRKVFMESRGFAPATPGSPSKRNRFSDSESDGENGKEPRNEPFVEYNTERRVQVVAVKKSIDLDDEEEHLRKGASSIKSKPSYRGGYK